MSFLIYKIILFVLILFLTFINLGNFVDITEEPQASDLIVALGGDGSNARIEKALEIYKQGFSSSKKIIYTGRDIGNAIKQNTLSRRTYLLNNNVNKKNIIHINMKIISNTMEEVLFIKKYMLAHDLKHVTFVSHPHHSRRIYTLSNTIAKYKETGLQVSIVGCSASWWNKCNYYTNRSSIRVTFRELIKLIYNLVKYGTPLIYLTDYYKENKDTKWGNIIKQL